MPRGNAKFAWFILAVLVVGVLAVYGFFLGQIALEKYTAYTTVEKVLARSYIYKVEYQPYWMRESDDKGIQVFYTNELSLQIVKGWDANDSHRLNVIITNAAQKYVARGKAFYVDPGSRVIDTPLIFNPDDYGNDFFIRVTSTYDGRIIVDTVQRSDTKWVNLLIDPNYLNP